jgi:hypothetical protein
MTRALFGLLLGFGIAAAACGTRGEPPSDAPVTSAVEAPAREGASGLAQVAWLAGSWRGTILGARIESHYFLSADATNPAAGPSVLIGLTHTGPDAATGTSETIRIEPTSTGLVLKGGPVGIPAAQFTASSVADREVVFDNIRGDAACPAPSRIRYALTDAGAFRETVTWAETCATAPPSHEVAYEQTRVGRAFGDACARDADCASNACFVGEGSSFCSIRCTAEGVAVSPECTMGSGGCDERGYCKR